MATTTDRFRHSYSFVDRLPQLLLWMGMGAEEKTGRLFHTNLHILCGDFRPVLIHMHIDDIATQIRRNRRKRLGMDDGLQSRIIDIPCARTLFQLNHLGHAAGVTLKWTPDRFAAGCAADGADLPTPVPADQIPADLLPMGFRFAWWGQGNRSSSAMVAFTARTCSVAFCTAGVGLRTVGHRSG